MDFLDKLQRSCVDFAQNPMAGGAKWEDITSRSRGAEDKPPTTFEANIGDARIVVTCGHRDYRPDWVFRCHELGFDITPLQSLGGDMSAKEAAEKAIRFCKARAEKMYKAFK